MGGQWGRLSGGCGPPMSPPRTAPACPTTSPLVEAWTLAKRESTQDIAHVDRHQFAARRKCCRSSMPPCTRNALQGPDLQNIFRQSYDCLTIMPKLRSTYDGRLISQNLLRRTPGFSWLRTCKIVRSSELVFAISLRYS